MVEELTVKNDTEKQKPYTSERLSGLKPWPPGVSGNPNGRPKKDYSVTSQAKALIDKDPEIARKIARKWLEDAIKGKTEARRDFQDRTEGKAPDNVNIRGAIIVQVVNEDGSTVGI